MTPSTLSVSCFNKGFCFLNSHTIKDKTINFSKALTDNPKYDIENGLIGAIKLYTYGYEKAIEKFSLAIHEFPNYALAYKYRAKAYESLEKYKEATADYNSWIKLQPDNAIAYLNRANCLADYDEEKALIEYTKALEFKPDYISAYNNRGRTYFSLDRKEEGILDFEQAIVLSSQKIEEVPNDAINYYYRAWALQKLNRYEEAMADFDKAIQLNPNHFASYFSRGYLKYNQLDFNGGCEDFIETVRLDPTHYYACFMLASCFMEIDKLKEAMIYCTQSLNLKQTANAFYLKGIILSNMQKYKDAQQSYEKTYELDPEISGLKKHISFLQHYNRLDSMNNVSKWQLRSLKFHIKRYEIEILAGNYFKKIKK
ncbi:MAG: tetratricopeptide repeat protein [Bacteroidota bacterium]